MNHHLLGVVADMNETVFLRIDVTKPGMECFYLPLPHAHTRQHSIRCVVQRGEGMHLASINRHTRDAESVCVCVRNYGDSSEDSPARTVKSAFLFPTDRFPNSLGHQTPREHRGPGLS